MDYPKPEQLSLDGNLKENWKKFRTHFEIYSTATKTDNEAEPIQVARLLSCAGPEAIELFHTFELAEADRKNIKKVIEKFENYSATKTNEVYERYKFYTRSQREGEPFDHFLKDIAAQVENCNFGTAKESMLRDRVVIGIMDKNTQTQLLKISDLTLQKAIETCRIAEISGEQIRVMQGETAAAADSSVHAVNKKGIRNKYHIKQNNTNDNNNNQYCSKNQSNNQNKYFHFSNVKAAVPIKNQKFKHRSCSYCNYLHEKGKCPAYGKNCNTCGKMNHFASACRKNRQISDVLCPDKDSEPISISDDTFYIDSTTYANIHSIGDNRKTCWMQPLQVHNKIINFKLDTGSQVNIIPKNLYKEFDPKPEMKIEKKKLEAYGGYKLSVVGSIQCKVRYQEATCNLDFIIVDANAQPLLGFDSCLQLNLIKRVYFIDNDETRRFIEENKTVFSGYGRFPEKCTLELKETACPVSKPPRRIPFSIRNRLKDTLDKMEERGIISKVDGPSSWCHNLVIVEKRDKSLRICLDPRELNISLKEEHFLIPALEDFRQKMNNMKYFTVLDLKEGFWQLELEESSKKLTIFSTPFGAYQFNVLPFGVKIAPEKFQKLNYKYFGELPGTFVYIDDIIVAGQTIEEHDDNLKRVMNRARELNIKFNAEKVQYRKAKVKYLGHIFSHAEIAPDPERITAIQGIKDPTNAKELQKLLGMINYLRDFIPNLSQMTFPLRELLKKHVEFYWTHKHAAALQEIKKSIQNSCVLYHFDSNIPTVIQTDASKYGIGCCLLQKGRPICYASKSLTDTEMNYAQIEKELLSIVYACKKFHNYIYGRKTIVQTDHKPLVTIIMKPLTSNYSARIQRMNLKLSKYDLSIEYLPGKRMYLADILSRNPIEDKEIEFNELLTDVVHSINMSDKAKLEYQEETKQDLVLEKIKEYYMNGWPTTKDKLTDNLKFYWNIKDKLYVEDALVFYEDRIHVPTTLIKKVLKSLHEGHFGITKTIERAKTIFYWPYMNRDIENMILRCRVCEKYRPANSKHTMLLHPLTQRPYEKIACDIFEYEGKNFLLTIDYFSKWIDVKLLQNKTASSVITAFKEIFSTHGIPEEVICDNQPFNSHLCRQFADRWQFKFTYTSPHYPKSNGLAERGVGIVKKMMKTCKESNEEFEMALMEYRATKLSQIGYSPSQLLMSRILRTKHPIVTQKLMPEIITKEAMTNICNAKTKQKMYYDRNAKRTELNVKEGNYVVYREGNCWKPAVVEAKCPEPRSFIIRNENHVLLRRNAEHLRKSLNMPQFSNLQNEEENQQETSTNINDKNQTSSNVQSYADTTQQLRHSSSNGYTTRSGRISRKPDFYIAK